MPGRSSKRSRGRDTRARRKSPRKASRRRVKRTRAKVARRPPRRKAKRAKRAAPRRARAAVTRTTVRASSVRTVRRLNPRRRRAHAAILVAKRGRTTLRFDGRNFSARGKPKIFGSLAGAYAKGERLLRRYAVLQSYKLYISPL